MYRFYYFCAAILFLVGFYYLTDWASHNPGAIARVHDQMEQTVDAVADKTARAVDEIKK